MSTVREEHGVACPRCGSDEHIEVVYTSWTRLVPYGTDDDNVLDHSVEYDNDSPTRCAAINCGWTGKFGDVHVAEPPTDDEVGEWVGQHYAKHFPSMDREDQDDFRQRYIAAHKGN